MAETVKKEKSRQEYMNELVPFMIPRERRDQGPEFISVNEQTWLVKRGEQVMIPRKAKLAWEEAERNRNAALDYMDEVSHD